MQANRGLTIHFMDGSKVSFGFPEQGPNVAAKQVKFEEFVKSQFLMVIADGVLMAFPIANIKSIQLPLGELELKEVRLPAHTIRDATLMRGDL